MLHFDSSSQSHLFGRSQFSEIFTSNVPLSPALDCCSNGEILSRLAQEMSIYSIDLWDKELKRPAATINKAATLKQVYAGKGKSVLRQKCFETFY